jgi:hypothetical protein
MSKDPRYSVVVVKRPTDWTPDDILSGPPITETIGILDPSKSWRKAKKLAHRYNLSAGPDRWAIICANPSTLQATA